MNEHAPPMSWPELLNELRKLMALIAPLQALLAQEEAPKISARINLFLLEIIRISDQMDRAVRALEDEQETRDLVRQLAKASDRQQAEISLMKNGITQILALLGEPLREGPSAQGRT